MVKENHKNQIHKLFFNRDLSWIDFNQRVLNEALNTTLPLLERVKFLSIFCSNLDEFYMIRVSALSEQMKLGINEKGIDGLTTLETLKAIENKIRSLFSIFMDCYYNEILPKLAADGIQILKYSELSDTEKECLKIFFDREIFPVLTPLAFDPGRPFPHISNLSINLAIMIETQNSNEKHFARVKVPNNLPRLININKIMKKFDYQTTTNGNYRIVFLEQIMEANIEKLFPKMKVINSNTFRITRDTDLEIQEDEADDLLLTIEENIKQRRFGDVVRIEIENEIPDEVKKILINNLELEEHSFHITNGPVGLRDLIQLLELPVQKLKVKSYTPVTPKIFETNENIFAIIKKNDILLSHPYHSFNPVVDFIKQAANDPNVLAIKQTLYRVGNNSPIIESLIEAAENGKQVAALVELKARFDEENNIHWARRLEKVGVHVVYGLIGLKTHCKMVLVIRKEGDDIVRYIHLGTGNYNIITSKIYSDFGYLTRDDVLASDVSELFNYLTGYSKQDSFRELLVAPINLRQRIIKLIKNEIEMHKIHKNGRLIFKMNAITDPEIIEYLYKASSEGVKIDLIVRGICMLKPQIKNISENINVISIVGRFLEHARIFYSNNNNEPLLYLGSADLMERNLNRRVEVLFPIKRKTLINYLVKNVLNLQLKDNFNSYSLDENGNYKKIISTKQSEIISSFSLQMQNSNKDITWCNK